MTTPRIDPKRLERFAEALAPAVCEQVKKAGPWINPREAAEDYAVGVTLELVKSVQRAGIEGIEHYYLCAHGALEATAATLGVPVSGLDRYLEGQ